MDWNLGCLYLHLCVLAACQVMTALFKFDLSLTGIMIMDMWKTVAWLSQKLCAPNARNIDLETQNRTIVEQLKMKTAECAE